MRSRKVDEEEGILAYQRIIKSGLRDLGPKMKQWKYGRWYIQAESPSAR
jgi:hypothetical protein